MKIAFGSADKVDLLRAFVGSEEYHSFWVGAVKWWPSARVASMVLKLKSFNGVARTDFLLHEPYAYFVTAYWRAQNSASDVNYVEVKTVSGEVYHLGESYNGKKMMKAKEVSNTSDLLELSWQKGEGPVVESLPVGSEVTIAARSAAWQETWLNTFGDVDYWVRIHPYPFIKGMSFLVELQHSGSAASHAFRIGGAYDNYSFVPQYNNASGVFVLNKSSQSLRVSASDANSASVIYTGKYDEYRYGSKYTRIDVAKSNGDSVVSSYPNVTVSTPSVKADYKFTVQSITKE